MTLLGDVRLNFISFLEFLILKIDLAPVRVFVDMETHVLAIRSFHSEKFVLNCYNLASYHFAFHLFFWCRSGRSRSGLFAASLRV